MFNTSYRITRIWGIPIKVHISLIVLLLLMAQEFGFMYGALVALGLLVSILLHELGHSLVAIKKGCRVREITLMFMGGAAQMDQIPTKPLDETLMAIAGPLVSLVLCLTGVFAGAQLNLPLVPGYDCNIIELIGGINLCLFSFNLLPAFPMDGGRILRAILTPKLGRLRATFHAARLGKIMAVLFGIWGLLKFNPMLIVISVLVYILAGQEYRMVQMQEAARTFGFGDAWNPFGTFSGSAYEQEEQEDKVIINPPSYSKEPPSKSNLLQFPKKNPFSDLFGQ